MPLIYYASLGFQMIACVLPPNWDLRARSCGGALSHRPLFLITFQSCVGLKQSLDSGNNHSDYVSISLSRVEQSACYCGWNVWEEAEKWQLTWLGHPHCCFQTSCLNLKLIFIEVFSWACLQILSRHLKLPLLTPSRNLNQSLITLPSPGLETYADLNLPPTPASFFQPCHFSVQPLSTWL